MGKGDPKKPRGKMSSYAFFVQTCREEHKKKHPDASVNFSEFSKKCSERWKTMSAKEKGKFEDMAKADKARYEREMKTYIPPKGETKKKFKDPNAPKRPPSAFFLFCSEYRPKIKGEHPGLSIGDVAKKLGEMWNNTAADDKQPYEKKAAKLKEKYEKDIAAYRAKGKPDAAKKGVVKAEKSKKKKEEEEDEEDEEDEEEEEDEEDEEEDDDDNWNAAARGMRCDVGTSRARLSSASGRPGAEVRLRGPRGAPGPRGRYCGGEDASEAPASAALSTLGPETPLSAGELHSCLGLEMLWPRRFGIFADGEEQMVQKVADLLVMKRK
nr:high mobility group protein B1-like [Nyctereutes procyonoides]